MLHGFLSPTGVLRKKNRSAVIFHFLCGSAQLKLLFKKYVPIVPVKCTENYVFVSVDRKLRLMKNEDHKDTCTEQAASKTRQERWPGRSLRYPPPKHRTHAYLVRKRFRYARRGRVDEAQWLSVYWGLRARGPKRADRAPPNPQAAAIVVCEYCGGLGSIAHSTCAPPRTLRP